MLIPTLEKLLPDLPPFDVLPPKMPPNLFPKSLNKSSKSGGP